MSWHPWKAGVIFAVLLAAGSYPVSAVLFKRTAIVLDQQVHIVKANRHLACAVGRAAAADSLVQLGGEGEPNYLRRLTIRGLFLIQFRRVDCHPPPRPGLVEARIRQIRRILAAHGRGLALPKSASRRKLAGKPISRSAIRTLTSTTRAELQSPQIIGRESSRTGSGTTTTSSSPPAPSPRPAPPGNPHPGPPGGPPGNPHPGPGAHGSPPTVAPVQVCIAGACITTPAVPPLTGPSGVLPHG